MSRRLLAVPFLFFSDDLYLSGSACCSIHAIARYWRPSTGTSRSGTHIFNVRPARRSDPGLVATSSSLGGTTPGVIRQLSCAWFAPHGVAPRYRMALIRVEHVPTGASSYLEHLEQRMRCQACSFQALRAKKNDPLSPPP